MAKEEILIDLKIDAAQSAKTLDEVAKSTRELERAKRQLDFRTEEGAKEIAKANQQINLNNQIIKENASALNKQRMNVGNYTDSIKAAVPALDSFTGGAVSAGQGISAMVKQMWTFVANPFGAILAAIAVAVGLVVEYFKKFEFALDIIENVTTQVVAVFDGLIQNLDKIGKIVGNVLIGNFSEAALVTAQLSDEIQNAANESQRLLDKTRDLEDAEIKHRIATAATANEIKALVTQSKNRNLTTEESNALLQKASDLEKESTESARKNAQERADIEEGKLVLSKRAQLEAADLLKKEGESQKEYINRIVDSGIFSPEQLEPLLSAYEGVEQAASEGLAFQEKVQNQLDAIAEKEKKRIDDVLKARLAAEAAIRDEVAKRVEAELLADMQADINEDKEAARDQKALEASAKRIEDKRLELEGIYLLNEELNIQLDEESVILDEKQEAALQKDLSRARQRVEIARLTEFQKLGFVSQGIALASNLLDRQSGEYKALAVTQGLINTYAGAAAAVAPPPVGAGPVFGPILAALTIASGLVNVGKIAGFANGGLIKMGAGLPIQRSNGDNVLATVKTGEVILNQRQQSALGGASTFRSIGVPGFAEGGVVGFPSSTISGATNSFFDLSRLEQTISNLKVQVAVTDINDGQKNYAEIVDRAQF